METFIIIAIALIVVLLLIRFFFKAAKNIATIAVALVLLVVGCHFFAPEYLDKFLGAERHAEWAEVVKLRTATTIDNLGEETKKAIDKVDK